MKTLNFKTLSLTGMLFVALSVGMVSCDKENETIANQPATAELAQMPATKDADGGIIRTRGFEGTITDANGNEVPIDSEWQERIDHIVNRALLFKAFLSPVVETQQNQ